MISMPALSGNVSVLSGNEEGAVEATPTPAAEATPVAEATIGPGSEQTIVVGNSNSNAANTNNRIAVPIQPNPPSNSNQ
jgi:hypothetical protein